MPHTQVGAQQAKHVAAHLLFGARAAEAAAAASEGCGAPAVKASAHTAHAQAAEKSQKVGAVPGTDVLTDGIEQRAVDA